MGHILANVSIHNQRTKYEHRDVSYVMCKCQNCDIGTYIIMAKICIAARRL